jgi:membrane-associated phospholipid phosphatase
MSSTTHPKGTQTPTATTTAGGENRQDAQRRHGVEIILWFLGLVVFIASCFVIHAHPKPYPFELATTQIVQGLHLWPWVTAVLEFPSTLNNPLPSEIALSFWFVGMLVVALVFRLKHNGLAALGWLKSSIFLVLTVMASAGLNVFIDELVGRPRPNPHTEPIHVYTPIVPFPTYPSGHTEHDVAYYGFLLYLSLTRPVREWKYRWLLLPLQLYAVFDILAIGYSRILEGDHWLIDVLGGYLEGALYLFFFIFLYRWVTDILAKRRAKKRARQPARV